MMELPESMFSWTSAIGAARGQVSVRLLLGSGSWWPCRARKLSLQRRTPKSDILIRWLELKLLVERPASTQKLGFVGRGPSYAFDLRQEIGKEYYIESNEIRLTSGDKISNRMNASVTIFL
jgi:hypothetical protein